MRSVTAQARALARERRVSAIIGIAAALVVHGALMAIFTLILLGGLESEPSPLVVVTSEADPMEQADQAARHPLAASKPSPPAVRAAGTIAAATAAAPVSMPEIARPIEDPLDALTGLGMGDRLGFGGLGLGVGASGFMGIEGDGQNMILVIDTSASMRRNCGVAGISAIRREITRTINGFRSGMSFNLICYANHADVFRRESVPATSANKAAAIRFMKVYFDDDKLDLTRTQSFGGDPGGAKDPWGFDYVPIYPDNVAGLEGATGGSRIDLGVVAAMERRPSTIFVLSDGEPNTIRKDKMISDEELVGIIKENHRRLYDGHDGHGHGLIINTLSIRELGEKFLLQVSGAFKGCHRKIEPGSLTVH